MDALQGRQLAGATRPGTDPQGFVERRGRQDVVLLHPRATSPVTRVLVVDDSSTFRELLRLVIDAQPDLECVDAVSTVRAGIEAAVRERPDVVLMDLRLPDGDGVAATQELRARCPEARVVVLTAYAAAETLAAASAGGACGFLAKESPVDVVLDTVRTARTGALVVEGAMLAEILSRLPAPRAAAHDPGLTPRERDVLAELGRGHDPAKIARRLGISLHTCRGHVKSILAKLDAHSQLEAVVRAVRSGLLAPDDDAGSVRS